MEEGFGTATIWFALAVISTLLSSRLRISMALMEICVGVAVAALLGLFGGIEALGLQHEWLRFFAALGSVLLTFLAGAELNPDALRMKLKEVSVRETDNHNCQCCYGTYYCWSGYCFYYNTRQKR